MLEGQPIPPNISLANIKFNWSVGTANWRDPDTGAITDFRGIKAKRADVEKVWSPATAQSTQRWAATEVQLMKDAHEVQPGIKRAALARMLKPRLDEAAKAGLVERTMKQKSLEQALSIHWHLWPVE